MKNYIKPSCVIEPGFAESIYMASGDCYTVNAFIHQSPQQGRGDYRIQAQGGHAATDNHHSSGQILTLSFNMPVAYIGSNGSLISGNNTSTIQIAYNYHNNANDNVGLGDVIVNADAGLRIVGAVLACNHMCNQH